MSPMNGNHEDAATEAKAGRKRVAEGTSDKKDDGFPIDCIIGSYGKYQFMIFLFKIIIG